MAKTSEPINLIDLLDRPIAFQRPFVTITGSITAALFLSQAAYWSKRCATHSDGLRWFYKTQADWEEETGMSRYEQESARKTLRNLGILTEKRIGVPAKLYFCINTDALNSLLLNPDSAQPSMRKTSNLDCGKPAILSAENQQSITEITTEITSDITDGASANAEPPASVEQKSQAKNTPYQSILDAYHKLLPEMPAIRELTDSRKTKIRNFWSKFKFNEERWVAYLQYIATNCRWMCEARKRRDGESSWKPKNLEFLITERCYLGVREGRFDDE